MSGKRKRKLIVYALTMAGSVFIPAVMWYIGGDRYLGSNDENYWVSHYRRGAYLFFLWFSLLVIMAICLANVISTKRQKPVDKGKLRYYELLLLFDFIFLIMSAVLAF